LSNSSHFPLTPYSEKEMLVALPPGRARLVSKPADWDLGHLHEYDRRISPGWG
jgi:hypothetical protein